MALRPCRECGREISTEATTCPQCGAPDPHRGLDSEPLPQRPPASATTRPQPAPEPAIAASAPTLPQKVAQVPKVVPPPSSKARPSIAMLIPRGTGEAMGPGFQGWILVVLFLAAGGLLLLLSAVFAAWGTDANRWKAAAISGALGASLVASGWGIRRLQPWGFALASLLAAALGGLAAYGLVRNPARWEWELAEKLQPMQKTAALSDTYPQAALVELSNRIAEAGRASAVGADDVKAIEARYGVRIGALRADGRVMYARYLRHFLEDDALNDEEREDLSALERLLSLAPADRDAVRTSVAAALYALRSAEAVADGRVDEDERARLDRIKRELGIDAGRAAAILTDQSQARVDAAARSAAQDQRLSATEAAELQRIAENLHVPLNGGAGGMSRKELDRYRLLWEIESGTLPTIPPPVNLHPGEVCYRIAKADLYEMRTYRTRVHYSGTSYSATFFATWYGGYDIKYDEQDFQRETKIDGGRLVITNRRLLFLGEKDNHSIYLLDILGIEPKRSGVGIQRDGSRDQFYAFSTDVDLFTLTLSRAIRDTGAVTAG